MTHYLLYCKHQFVKVPAARETIIQGDEFDSFFSARKIFMQAKPYRLRPLATLSSSVLIAVVS
jgi:hypothetical protein